MPTTTCSKSTNRTSDFDTASDFQISRSLSRSNTEQTSDQNVHYHLVENALNDRVFLIPSPSFVPRECISIVHARKNHVLTFQTPIAIFPRGMASRVLISRGTRAAITRRHLPVEIFRHLSATDSTRSILERSFMKRGPPPRRRQTIPLD